MTIPTEWGPSYPKTGAPGVKPDAKCKWCGCDKPSPDHWDTEIDFS